MSFMFFLFIVVAATGAGFTVVRRFPWSEAAQATSLPLAMAFGLGPFLTGLVTVAVLWVLPGAAHALHVTIVVALLTVCAIPGWRALFERRKRLKPPTTAREILLWVLLVGFVVTLFIGAITTARMTQNDALEYATVGRILYETGDLRAYPVLDAAISSTGFYAPWTHPPLYVALSYLTYALDGNANDTTLFRLIAPWCLVAAAFCVFAIGERTSRSTGLLAALICISTPMLYLGANSAQIDSLAVLGFVLAFGTFTSLDGGIGARGVASGLMLGIAMWAHSQAILFPALLFPLLLMAQPSFRGWRERLKTALAMMAIALVVSLLVAAPPYLHNLAVFGSLISDTPVVFAYPPLGWDDFFRLQRGLAQPLEIVEFGVLKGFFAVEVFSFWFWLALLAVPAALGGLILRLRTTGAAIPATDGNDFYVPSALIVVAIYLGGAAVSALAGISIMIRNDRYMLVLMPCVALLGAVALCRVDGNGRALTRWFRGFVLLAVLSLLCLQLLALAVYRYQSVRYHASAASRDLNADGSVGDPSEFLRLHTAVDAKVLAMQPAEMFYAERTMVSYLDPRMMPFYGEKDTARAFEILRHIGVSYVQLPDYALPPIYNSQLANLLADPRYSELLYDRGGYQIYRLRDTVHSLADDSVFAATPLLGWQRINRLKFGSAGDIETTVSQSDYSLGAPAVAWNNSLLLRRFTPTSLISSQTELVKQTCVNGQQATEYSVKLRAAGQGFIQILVNAFSQDGAVERISIGGGPLADESRERSFTRRILISPRTHAVSLEVEYRPVGSVRILGAEIRPTCA